MTSIYLKLGPILRVVQILLLFTEFTITEVFGKPHNACLPFLLFI